MSDIVPDRKVSRRAVRINPLTDWVRFATADPDLLEGGACTAIALVRSERGMESEVYTAKLAGGSWTPETLAEKLYGIAREHCKDEPGVEHKYKLLAFYGDSNDPKANKGFALSPYGEQVEYLNEAPDARGGNAQGMRHLETLAQGYFRGIQATTIMLASENKDLREENRSLFVMVKDMITTLSQSQFDKEMKLAEFHRQTGERRQLMAFAPALVNTVLGKEVFPQNAADTALIDALAENITEDQIQKLAATAGEGGLPPEVFGPLAMRVHKALKDKREAAEKAKTHLATVRPMPGRTAEDDAAGD